MLIANNRGRWTFASLLALGLTFAGVIIYRLQDMINEQKWIPITLTILLFIGLLIVSLVIIFRVVYRLRFVNVTLMILLGLIAMGLNIVLWQQPENDSILIGINLAVIGYFFGFAILMGFAADSTLAWYAHPWWFEDFGASMYDGNPTRRAKVKSMEIADATTSHRPEESGIGTRIGGFKEGINGNGNLEGQKGIPSMGMKASNAKENLNIPSMMEEKTKKSKRRIRHREITILQDWPDPQPFSAQALYTFDASSTSELGFQKGDKLEILDCRGNWWNAKIHGTDQTGFVPSNFIQVLQKAKVTRNHEPENIDEVQVGEGEIVEVMESYPFASLIRNVGGKMGSIPTECLDFIHSIAIIPPSPSWTPKKKHEHDDNEH